MPQRALKVFVSEAEQAAIDGAAKRLGMSTSAYLRALGLGYQPIGHLDKEAAERLDRVNADLSRLGNLLKLWLSDDAKLAVFKPGQAVALHRQAPARDPRQPGADVRDPAGPGPPGIAGPVAASGEGGGAGVIAR